MEIQYPNMHCFKFSPDILKSKTMFIKAVFSLKKGDCFFFLKKVTALKTRKNAFKHTTDGVLKAGFLERKGMREIWIPGSQNKKRG